MRPILIDTNAYSAFMRGDSVICELIVHAEKLHLNSIILGELLDGFAGGSREAKNRAELSKFLASPRVSVFPITTDTADSYALVFAQLRQKGQPIPANDVWIAASALEHGIALLSLDFHFSHISGLRCGSRMADFLT